VLVLLADIVLLAEVDEEDDRLGGQKEERVDDLDLANCKHTFIEGRVISNANIGVVSGKGRLFIKSWRY
jgi:hypothetical protein